MPWYSKSSFRRLTTGIAVLSITLQPNSWSKELLRDTRPYAAGTSSFSKVAQGQDEVTSLVERADSLESDGQLEQALDLYKKALSLHEKSHERQEEQLAYILYSIGTIYLSLEKYSLSESYLRRDLLLTKKISGASSADTATSQLRLGEALYNQRRYKESRDLYSNSLALREELFGKDSLEAGEVLFLLGLLHTDSEDFESAISSYKRELQIVRLHLGESHISAAVTLNNLGYVQRELGLLKESLESHEEALRIKEGALAKDDPDIAISLNNLAGVNEELGLFGAAETLHQKALAIRLEAFGRKHPDTANTLHNLGGIYTELGQLKKAEKILLEALEIREETLGKNHPLTGATIAFLGSVSQEANNFEKALRYLKRALAIYRAHFGEYHTEVGMALNNLGLFYDKQASYSESEKYYLEALRIFREIHRDNHPDIAIVLNNLASIAADRGLQEKAISLFEQSLQIVEQVYGLDHHETATSLSNLAGIYRESGDLEKAKELSAKALSINQQTFGKYHPLVGVTSGNLGGIYEDMGLLDEAEKLYITALQISRSNNGDKHEDTAIALGNLGLLYLHKKDYPLARKYISESVEIARKTLGHSHPTTIGNTKNLIWLFDDQGDVDKSIPLLQQVLEGDFRFVQREAPFMVRSDRQKLIDELDHGLYERVFTYALENKAGLDLALFARLNRHGLLEELEKKQAALTASLDEDQVRIVRDLRDLTSRLSFIGLSSKERDAINQKRDRLEADLYRFLPRIKPRVVSTSDIVDALTSTGQVLIEFQKFSPYSRENKGFSRSSNYMALILKPDGTSDAIELGQAESIDTLITNTISSLEQLKPESNDNLSNLYDLIIRPLHKSLAGYSGWLISPDGEMNRVPFAALIDGQADQLLSDRANIRLLTTGRELLVENKHQASEVKEPLVIADPDYGEGDRQAKVPVSTASTSSEVLRSNHLDDAPEWKRLPATSKEGEVIHTLMGGKLLTRTSAKANSVKDYGAASILHLATHAFYLPSSDSHSSDSIDNRLRSGKSRASFGLRKIRTESPLLRSGIVLAGANQPNESSDDDGYLTALEVIQLDWQGTKLVVISACESGRGDIQAGEGVYGLKRAIAVAGARSSLLSLWKVDDAATAAFMRYFYGQIVDGNSLTRSLKESQLFFRNHPIPAWRHPYYWAAFQLSGDWQPVSLKSTNRKKNTQVESFNTMISDEDL